MKIRISLFICGLFATASCTAIHQLGEPCSAARFPTLSRSRTLEETERQEIMRKCGITAAKQISIRALDLDRDQKEDYVLTIELPPEIGGNWRNYRSLTYVFRGTQRGLGGWETATPWFSLVTYEAQDHVKYGDSETVRQFSIFCRRGKWFVTIYEYEYESEGREPSESNMVLKRSNSWTRLATEMPAASPKYP
jgi:hypothetical protein